MKKRYNFLALMIAIALGSSFNVMHAQEQADPWLHEFVKSLKKSDLVKTSGFKIGALKKPSMMGNKALCISFLASVGVLAALCTDAWVKLEDIQVLAIVAACGVTFVAPIMWAIMNRNPKSLPLLWSLLGSLGGSAIAVKFLADQHGRNYPFARRTFQDVLKDYLAPSSMLVLSLMGASALIYGFIKKADYVQEKKPYIIFDKEGLIIEKERILRWNDIATVDIAKTQHYFDALLLLLTGYFNEYNDLEVNYEKRSGDVITLSPEQLAGLPLEAHKIWELSRHYMEKVKVAHDQTINVHTVNQPVIRDDHEKKV